MLNGWRDKRWLIFLSFVFLLSCGEADPRAGISALQIQMPSEQNIKKISSGGLPFTLTNNSAQSPSTLSDIWATAFEPTDSFSFNCFGITVSSPDGDVFFGNNDRCELAGPGDDIVFGVSSMGNLPNSIVSIDVPKGTDRLIRIIGWRAETPEACQTLQDGQSVDSKKLSHPFVIGELTTDLLQAQVSVDIIASLIGSERIHNCNIFNADINSLSLRTFSIAGTVENNKPEEVPGDSLILSLNGIDEIEVSEDTFFFPNELGDGVPFNVSISQQPSGKDCEISNNDGVINGDNFTDVQVSCVDLEFNISGEVTGLAEEESLTIELTREGEVVETANLTDNGSFSFEEIFLFTDEFSIEVTDQPASQICIVENGQGIVFGDIDDVLVRCFTEAFSVGGDLSGLLYGRVITLQNNGGDDLALNQNGGFVFSTDVPEGLPYNVEVSTQPVGQTCTVSNGSGTMGSEPVTGISVTCVPDEFLVGGSINGMAQGQAVGLVISTTPNETTVISNNGPFFFLDPVESGLTYNVSISTHPQGQFCTISNASGEVLGENITNIMVSCSDIEE